MTLETHDVWKPRTTKHFHLGGRPALSPDLFKYYIHDTTEALRVELIGDLRERHVVELSGCLETARVTLGDRCLVIDMQSLRSSDAHGKEWLLAMLSEGAKYLQGSYVLTDLASSLPTPPKNTGILSRVLPLLLSVLRCQQVTRILGEHQQLSQIGKKSGSMTDPGSSNPDV